MVRDISQDGFSRRSIELVLLYSSGACFMGGPDLFCVILFYEWRMVDGFGGVSTCRVICLTNKGY